MARRHHLAVVAVFAASLAGCGLGDDRATDAEAPTRVAATAHTLVGNGLAEPGEECDDGNTADGDGCSSTGAVESGFHCWVPGNPCSPTADCGNGALDSGEACDLSASGNAGTGCTDSCDFSDCGNGARDIRFYPSWQNEICDDGNRFDGDGCSRLCEVEAAWACKGEPSRCLLAGVTLFNTGVGDDRQRKSSGTDPHWRYSLDDHAAIILEDSQLAGDWPAISQTSNVLNNYPGHPVADRPGCVYQDFTVPSRLRAERFRLELATFNDNDFLSVSVNGERVTTRTLLVPSGGQPWQRLVLREIPSSAPWVVGRNRLEVCNDHVVSGATGFRYIVADAYDDACGDGLVSPREECDDGNTSDGDGCSATCGIEPRHGCVGEPSQCAETCGNGLLNPGEQCDDGDLDDGDGCSVSCRVEASYTCAVPDAPCQQLCGNGTLDNGEQCDDGNLFTSDGCQPNCRVARGYACDGAPSSCTRLCGNGALDDGEQCDDGNAASGDGCSIACTLELEYACPTPGAACAMTCGNSVLDAGEQCDDDNVISGDGCSSECMVETGWACPGAGACAMTCGDGTIDPNEACDDGNTDDDDGCTGGCEFETGFTCNGEPSICSATCGDGLVAGDEVCDDTQSPGADGDGCDEDCQPEAGWVCPAGSPCVQSCGNGVVEAGEACDDGNTDSDDGCGGSCALEAGFACGSPLGPCAPVCGDGRVVRGEACDDGNLDAGDACTNTCLRSAGQACTGSDQCDGVCNPVASTCAPVATCGNGLPESGEGCDDGNATGGDGCSTACLRELGQACTAAAQCGSGVCDLLGSNTCEAASSCGNGLVEAGEACDDGNATGGDGCSSACLRELGALCGSDAQCATSVCNLGSQGTPVCVTPDVCGNGKVETGEACDDGNTADDGNGCTGACLLTNGQPCAGSAQCLSGVCDLRSSNRCESPNVCGNGVVEGSEGCDDGSSGIGDGCNGICRIENGYPCVADQSCGSGVCDLAGSQRCEAAFTCGNGRREASEACDDGNTTGGDDCTAGCRFGLGVPCAATANCGTGSVCDLLGSSTCEAENTCGNGTVEAGEACDDGAAAAGDGCDDQCLRELGQACTDGGQCASTVCDLAGASTCEPADTCGNGTLEGTEVCDDGNSAPGDGCSAACLRELGQACTDGTQCASTVCDTGGSDTCEPPNTCGNGSSDAGEACDDGGVVPGDGCSGTCLLELGQGCAADADCETGVCDLLGSSTCELPDTCGNGKLETGEACDDGNTTADANGCGGGCKLDDGQGCTADAQCTSGACDLRDSQQCEPADTCGNGNVEGAELCDDGDADDDDLCTTQCLRGTGGPCANDSQCDTGRVCDLLDSRRCETASTCGNGKVDGGEACDDGNTSDDGNGCDATCQRTDGARCADDGQCASGICNLGGGAVCAAVNACGNGRVEAGEGCDDGNATAGDGCAACRRELGQACGDSADCGSGVCDTLVSGLCESANTCGNGTVEAGEFCDDGSTTDGDGCSQVCLAELGGACSDDAECWSGVCNEGAGECQARRLCGNTAIDPGEYCDDGNTADGDGCNAACLREDGQACTGSAQCAGVCDTRDSNTCEPARLCGNGTVDTGEVCDDGNTDPDDGCSAGCLVEVGGPCLSSAECAGGLCNTALAECRPAGECGNGALEAGEACDDGNFAIGDGCDLLCQRERGQACLTDDVCAPESICDTRGSGQCEAENACGNGLLEDGEVCDDGNLETGDGCDGQCLHEDGSGCDADDECASARCGIDGRCGGAIDQSCQRDSDCRGPVPCHLESGRCGRPAGEGCSEDVQCRSGGCSMEGACLAELGAECEDDDVCGAGSCADDGRCGGLPGDPCGNRLQCRALSCDSDAQQCRRPDGEACDDDAQCAARACDDDGLCGRADDGRCATDTECRSGLCLSGSGTCARARGADCDDDAQCASGVCAIDGACGESPGSACTDDGLCRQGYCDPGDALCGGRNGRPCEEDGLCRSTVCNPVRLLCAPNASCGNGVVEEGEGCDDGNLTDRDGCGSACGAELGFPCATQEDCEAGGVCDLLSGRVCELPNVCGNGILDRGEVCDDGNEASGDGCDPVCFAEVGTACVDDDDCVSEYCAPETGLCENRPVVMPPMDEDAGVVDDAGMDGDTDASVGGPDAGYPRAAELSGGGCSIPTGGDRAPPPTWLLTLAVVLYIRRRRA